VTDEPAFRDPHRDAVAPTGCRVGLAAGTQPEWEGRHRKLVPLDEPPVSTDIGARGPPPRRCHPRAEAGTGITVLVGGATAIQTDFAHVLSSKLIFFLVVIVLPGSCS